MSSKSMKDYIQQLFEQSLSLMNNKETLSEAKEKLELILQAYPDFTLTYYALGYIHYLENNFDDAMKHWSRSVELDSYKKEASYGISQIYDQRDNAILANKFLNQARKMGYLEDEIFDISEEMKKERLDSDNYIENSQNSLYNMIKKIRFTRFYNYKTFSCTILTIFLAFLLSPILKQGLPIGSDMYAHLFLVWNFWKSFRSLAYPIWSPFWYGGYPIMLTYAPISHIITALISLPINNYILGTKISIILSYIAGAIGFFLLSREYKLNNYASFTASIAYSISYHRIVQTFLRGSLSNSVALAFLPFFFLYVIKFYSSIENNDKLRNSYKYLILSSFFLMLTFLSHLSIGVLSIILLTSYAFYYILYDLMVKKSNSAMKYLKSYLLIIVFFMLFSSFWLIPMISYTKYSFLSNTITFSSANLAPSLTRWISNLPGFLNDLYQRNFGWYPWYLGISVGIFSGIAIVMKYKKYPQNFMPFLFIISLFLTSDGLPLIATRLGIDVTRILEPWRSFSLLMFSGCLLTGLFVHESISLIKKRLKTDKKEIITFSIVILVISIIYVDLSPGLANIRTTQVAEPFKKEFDWLKSKEGIFRVYSHGVFPIQGSMERYGPAIHEQEILHGSDEGSITYETYRNVEELNWIVKHAGSDPVLADRLIDVLTRKFRYSNTKYFVVGPTIFDIRPSLDASDSFIKYEVDPSINIYEFQEPSTPVHPVQRVLLIGDEKASVAAQNALFYCPSNFTYEITYESEIDSLNPEKLSKYNFVILYGITQETSLVKLEPSINTYLQQGGKAIIDLSGIKNGTTFLGVESIPINYHGDVTVRVNSEYLDEFQNIPRNDFSYAEDNGMPWYFQTYSRLAEEMATINNYTLIGYKDVEDGRAYFMGFNFLYHIEYTKNEQERQFFNAFFNNVIEEGNVTINIIERSNGRLQFDIEIINSSENLLISESFFPGWKVTDNGEILEISQTRDGWILITLEEGPHEVVLQRVASPPYKIGFLLSFFTVGLAIFIYFRFDNVVETRFT